MVTDVLPYPYLPMEQFLKSINQTDFRKSIPKGKSVSKDCFNLLENLLNKKSDKRPNIETVIKNSWILKNTFDGPLEDEKIVLIKKLIIKVDQLKKQNKNIKTKYGIVIPTKMTPFNKEIENETDEHMRMIKKMLVRVEDLKNEQNILKGKINEEKMKNHQKNIYPNGHHFTPSEWWE